MCRVFMGGRMPSAESTPTTSSMERAHASLLAPRHWPTWLLLGVGWLVAQLPYALLLRIGGLIGMIGYYLRPKRHRRAAKQLRLCFPAMSAHAVQRLRLANAQSYGIGLMERLIGWWWPVRRTERLLNSVRGLEHLQRAQREGRGVILLVLHTTTMEICATLLRRHIEVDFMYQASSNPVLEWVQRRGRSRPEVAPAEQASANTAAIESASTRTMIRRLRAGRVVWYSPDRDFGPDKAHVHAPLFGMPAATITATSRYAKMSGAQVLTLEFWRDAQGGYSAAFGAPLQNLPSDSDVDDCTRINAWIEAAVRRHPEQYRWVHKRFRTQPVVPVGDQALQPLSSQPAAANAAVAPATSHATAA
jgi:KDO2-lipid IV(A) lauroyltransferase